jgi:hypothetical protein
VAATLSENNSLIVLRAMAAAAARARCPGNFLYDFGLCGQFDVTPQRLEERLKIDWLAQERYGTTPAQNLAFEREVFFPMERHTGDHDDRNMSGHMIILQIHDEPLTSNSWHVVIGKNDIRTFRHRQDQSFLGVVRSDHLDSDGFESPPKRPRNIGVVIDKKNFGR